MGSVNVLPKSVLWNDTAAELKGWDAAGAPAGSTFCPEPGSSGPFQGSVFLVISRPTVWEQDSSAFGSVPELNTAPSISSLASHSYDGLDLGTICFPSACIQLSLGQQSPFQLQPRGMGVGRLLHWLLSVARKRRIRLETHSNDPFLAGRGKTGRTCWSGQPEQ